MSTAEEAKNLGNEAMNQKNYDEAIRHYTKAIELDSSNHVLYSNRSAAYLSQGNFAAAAEDGDKAIKLKPDWSRGYSRKGQALYKQGNLEEALNTYEEGAKQCPDDARLREVRDEVMMQLQQSQQMNMFASIGKLFQDPNVLVKIASDPTLKSHLSDPGFIQMISEIQQNPAAIAKYMQDERLMSIMGLLLQGSRAGPAGGASSNSGPAPMETEPEPFRYEEKPKPAEPKKTEKKPAPEKPAKELTPEQKEALEEKTKGNEAYGKKDYATALNHYNRAIELDPTDITFRTNRAACYYSMQEYQKCVDEAKEAVDIGHENKAEFSAIAKAYARMGAAYRTMKLYAESIEAYEKSLMEHRTRDTQKILQQVQQEKAKADQQAYLNPDIAIQEKDKGNELFKQSKWPEAIAAYSEAIKRDPTNAVFYSNRAAAYSKVAQWNLALEDCDKCLKLDPTSLKAFRKKGAILSFMKQYHRAIPAFKLGLTYHPNDPELTQGLEKCYRGMQGQEPVTEEQKQERLARAMADPEVQNIMKDPMMREVLFSIQSNPASLYDYLRDKDIAHNLEVLIAAGVIGTQ